MKQKEERKNETKIWTGNVQFSVKQLKRRTKSNNNKIMHRANANVSNNNPHTAIQIVSAKKNATNVHTG